MAEENIKCPHCGEVIHLNEALFHQMGDKIRRGIEEESNERIKVLTKREGDLKAKEAELAGAKETLDQTVKERLATERVSLRAEAGKEARAALDTELKDLRSRDEEKTKRLEEAQRAELTLRRQARQLEEEKKAMEVTVARKLDAERESIRKDALEIFSEEHRLKDLEKTKKISDMHKTIEDLKRQSEQSSMQTQGEVAELDLEELLKRRFPIDDVAPVAKGIRGADILQRVYTKSGAHSGTIIWEIKNTKAWSDGWIEKLKEDQREANAELAVLVSKALPQGVESFKDLSGVWVTNFQSAPALAEVLRYTLIELARSKISLEGRGEKMDLLYNYMSGPGFRQKIEAIVEAFTMMKSELDSEKRAMGRIWAKREKQIERVVTSTTTMYGDMQGIIGASLPQIQRLELGGGEDEGED